MEKKHHTYALCYYKSSAFFSAIFCSSDTFKYLQIIDDRYLGTNM